VSLRNIPAKIRILKGVTRVEPLDPTQPGQGFRDLPNEHVDAGIELSLDFDANGNLELWPPDPLFNGEEEDPASALDLDLGWFRVSESPLYLNVSGLGFHRANTAFPDGFEVPEGLDEAWSGFIAEEMAGFWWKEPANNEPVHVYGISFHDLLVGNDVFALHGSFEHNGGPDDPFNSTVPVPAADLPESRYSLRKIEVWVAEGAGDILQFGGKVTVAAIIGLFRNRPVKFEASLGRILKEIPIEVGGQTEMMALPFVQLVGALAPVQNHTQPLPDGSLRVPMFEASTSGEEFAFHLNGVRFELDFPGGTVEGVDIPTVIQLQTDLGLKLGSDPIFEAEVPGVGFVYPHPDGVLGSDFKVLWEGLWLDTAVGGLALGIKGYEFSISRIGFGKDAGDASAYWIAFDSNINFPDSLGRAQVYGMKLGWDDDGTFFDIEGVGVEVKKPGFEFAGIVKFLNASSSFVPEGAEPIEIQDGSLSGFIRLAFLGVGDPFVFEVGLTHGKYKRLATGDIHSFWMLMAELVFPYGLPLGLADLAFYGLALAVGNNVMPRKLPTTSWFDWYSKELPKYSVIAPTKWTAAHDRFAFGLGLVLGSSVRSGYPHNERLLGVYNSAGGGQSSTWLFEGKVRFLKEVTKPGDPQIAILLVIAPDQILFRAEFHFVFPAEGSAAPAGLVTTARGMIEVLNDRTGGGRHHVYLGKNQPYSERINSSVLLGFFTARSFFMLDWADLQLSNATLPAVAMAFGFAQGWNFNKKFGPLRFYLEANIELEVGFSFSSALYGFLRIYGGIGFRIFGFGFGLGIDAAFTLFVSDGWSLTGEIKVKLNLPWPIPDYKKTIPIDLGPGTNPPAVLRSPLRQLSLSSPSFDGTAPIHEWSENNVLGVPADFDADRSLLAVDGAVSLAFRVPAGKRVPWIAGVDAQPVDGSGEWQFRYMVEDVILRHKPPGATSFQPVPNSLKNGFWEITSLAPATPSAPTTGGVPLSQTITIWGETPGEQLRNLGNLERSGSITWLDGYIDYFRTWPCGPDVVLDPVCVHYDLESFRLLDSAYTRVTLLPNGTPIRSHSTLNPDEFPIESDKFVVLDEVVQNPRPDLWERRAKVLSLPYLYTKVEQQFVPFSSSLDVDLSLATFVEITLIGGFREEEFKVQGFHDDVEVANAAATGSGVHVLTLEPKKDEEAINRVRISSITNQTGRADAKEFAFASVLGSICYRALEQKQLQQHILEGRESLSQLIEILEVPPGLPGNNAQHFRLHPQGTVYEITPVVTCERKGPETNWEVVHDHVPVAPVTVTAGPPPKDLTPYLAETIPGFQQDPVYLDDDMQLRFNRSYGPEMYTVSGFDFRAEVLDAQRQPIPIEMEWTFSEEPALSPAQELLLEALLSSPCVAADITAVRKKLVLVLRPEIRPRTYYYLVLRSNAHPNINLYEAPFMTSRYVSFDEQYAELQSTPIHELLPQAPDNAMLETLLGSLPAATREDEHALFEKVWEDALGLAFRERPQKGELVVFYAPADTTPPRVAMIDSPEPLFVDRRTQLEVEGPAGVSTVVVRNRDGSRALLFALDGDEIVDLPAGDYVLTTTYLREVPGLPTQRIAGDSSPSTASITLSVTAEAQILMEVL
jgi:hypothetical protein